MRGVNTAQKLAFAVMIICLLLCAALIAQSLGVLELGMGSLGASESGEEGAVKLNEADLNCLVLGVDKGQALTDVIMWAQYDADTEKINILNIPRDTYIRSNRWDKKANSIYAVSGMDGLLEEMHDLTGAEIDHYVLIDTKALREAVDAIGGVEVDVPQNMHYEDPVQNLYIHLNKGLQVLDGNKAEQFVRFRGYAAGDVARIEAQQQFLQAVVKKITGMSGLLNAPKLVSVALDNVETNFTASEVKKLVEMAFGFEAENVAFHTLPGEGSYIGDASYFIHDPVETEMLIETYFTDRGGETE